MVVMVMHALTEGNACTTPVCPVALGIDNVIITMAQVVRQARLGLKGILDGIILSTESCDICETCSYLSGEPCRYPDRMHPCLESHGVVASEIVEKHQMEYNLGGNTILWFSLILYRPSGAVLS